MHLQGCKKEILGKPKAGLFEAINIYVKCDFLKKSKFLVLNTYTIRTLNEYCLYELWQIKLEMWVFLRFLNQKWKRHGL